MKKFLKIVLVFLAIVVVAMLVIGKKYHYEKSIVINAPVEKVWQNVNSMKAVNSWSPFLDYDKNMKQTYSGVSGQVGDTYHWSGNDEAGEGEGLYKLEQRCQEQYDKGYSEGFDDGLSTEE